MNKEALTIVTVSYVHNGCRCAQNNQKGAQHKTSAGVHGGRGRDCVAVSEERRGGEAASEGKMKYRPG